MLLTIKEVARQLQVRPSTLYAWVAQRKIPCRKIHGLLRFDPDEIDRWVASFKTASQLPPLIVEPKKVVLGLDQLIARAKREVYTPGRGNQTKIKPHQEGGNGWGS